MPNFQHVLVIQHLVWGTSNGVNSYDADFADVVVVVVGFVVFLVFGFVSLVVLVVVEVVLVVFVGGVFVFVDLASCARAVVAVNF